MNLKITCRCPTNPAHERPCSAKTAAPATVHIYSSQLGLLNRSELQAVQLSSEGLDSHRGETEQLLRHCSRWTDGIYGRITALQAQILPTFEVRVGVSHRCITCAGVQAPDIQEEALGFPLAMRLVDDNGLQSKVATVPARSSRPVSGLRRSLR